MKFSQALLLTTTLIATTATAMAPTTLKMSAKKGDSHTLNLKFDVDFEGQALVYTDTRKLTVKSHESNGNVVMTEIITDSTIDMGGEPQPAGMDGESTYTYSANGEILKLVTTDSEQDEYRFANMTNIIWPDKPVEVGSKWEKSFKESTERNTYPTTFKYEIQAEDKVNGKDAFKIKYSVAETKADPPALSNGTFWVEKSTGWILKGEGTVQNMPVTGMSLNATFTITSK